MNEKIREKMIASLDGIFTTIQEMFCSIGVNDDNLSVYANLHSTACQINDFWQLDFDNILNDLWSEVMKQYFLEKEN